MKKFAVIALLILLLGGCVGAKRHKPKEYKWRAKPFDLSVKR